MSRRKLAVVVLISGRGSNLQAIIESAGARDAAYSVAAVISNRPGAAGLQRAERAGIATRVVDHKAHASREAFDTALARAIDAYRPGLVVLAGFMRVLGTDFVTRYAGRLINVHPSLLPAFPGLDTHRRVIESGSREHGASVHFVTPGLDSGPLIVQAHVPVLADDDADSLAERVLAQEHRILPRAITWFAQGRLRVRDHDVLLDGQPALRPG